MRTEQVELTREEIYREWLGLNNPAPTCYGLLGVPELESDENAIQYAARRVKRKLRAYQIGLYRKQALEILAEVGQAVSVLTNAEKKRAYDNDLVRRWRAAIEELYQTHCKTPMPEPAAVELWLSACLARGISVTRLMPRLMRALESRSEDWARQGEVQVSFPISLWLYRDVIILGQCLHVGTLEQRSEAVKQVQKLLGVPEGLVRLMVEEVARGLHLFTGTRIVRQAQRKPDEVLLRLARRIRRFGGHVGPRCKVLAAAATLVGKHKRDLEHVLQRMDELPVDLLPIQAAAMQARRAKEKVEEAGHRAWEVKDRAKAWVASHPQVLVGLAAVTGVAALVLAYLVATGHWRPFGESAPLRDLLSVERPAKQPGWAPPPPKPSATEHAPAEALPDVVTPDLIPVLQDLRDFIKNRSTGTGAGVTLPPLKLPEPPSKGQTPPVKPPSKDPKNGGSEIKFFGVEGTPATPAAKDKPPDVKPLVPAPKS